LIVFIASIFLKNYTTVHTPPDGTVTTAPEEIVIGPKLPAFCATGIV
jgi:hypothetical protein